MLSLPLLVAARVVGAMNVYAHSRDAFSVEAIRLGELFAVPAAVSVLNAQLIADSQRLVGQLSEALTSRSTIDQALGLLMAMYGDTAEDAFVRLTTISQHRNRKLRIVAQELLEDGVRRARARPRPTPPKSHTAESHTAECHATTRAGRVAARGCRGGLLPGCRSGRANPGARVRAAAGSVRGCRDPTGPDRWPAQDQ